MWTRSNFNSMNTWTHWKCGLRRVSGTKNIFGTRYTAPIYNPIFWQCVWQIRQTVSLYHSSFRQCPWHIRSTTMSNFLSICVTYQENCITVSSHFPTMSVTYQANNIVKEKRCIIPFSDNVCEIWGQLNCQRKEMGGKRTEKITAVTVTTTTLPVNCLTATDCNAAACAYFLTMGAS